MSLVAEILDESASAGSNSATTAALAGVPFLLRALAWEEGREEGDNSRHVDGKKSNPACDEKQPASLARKRDAEGRVAAAYVTKHLRQHSPLEYILRLTRPSSEDGRHVDAVPPAVQRSALVCLRLLLDLYTTAFLAISGKHFDAFARQLERSTPVGAFSLVTALTSTNPGRNPQALGGLFPGEDTLTQLPAPTPSTYDLFIAPVLPAIQQETGNQPSSSPHVRMANWAFLLEACRRCTLSELRRLTLHKMVLPEVGTATCKEDRVKVSTNDNSEETGIDFGANIVHKSSSALWLLSCPFLDSDRLLRLRTARALGPLLLRRESKVLFALFLPETKWKERMSRDFGSRAFVRDGDSDAAVAKLFREIDRLLFKHCSVNQSQLSYTAAPATESTAGTLSSSGAPMDNKLSHRETAVRALGSLCEFADLDTAHGTKIFEHSLLRLIRMWVQPANDLVAQAEMDPRAFTFAELRRIDKRRPFSPILRDSCKDSFVPALFSEVLVPGSGADGNVEKQFQFLMVFIHSFLSTGGSSGCTDFGHMHTESINEMLDYTDSVYPTVFSALCIEQDYEALRMCSAFRLYLVGQFKEVEKAGKRKDPSGTTVLVGFMKKRRKAAIPGVGTSTKKLNDHTKRLCNSPEILERVLPKLLMHPDRAPLVFFLRTINQSELNLRQLLHAKEHSVLKALFWELSKADHDTFNDDAEDTRQAIQALKKGAILVRQEEQMRSEEKEDSKPKELKRSHTLDSIDAMNTDASTTTGYNAAVKWVSSNFIMLHVNLVSQKWKIKSDAEKIRALRVLRAMLHFLVADDSPNYTTHVLSTVNQCFAAASARRLTPSVAQMQFLAVQIMARYVHVLLENNDGGIKAIGENLTSIVVSLFPVLDHEARSIGNGENGGETEQQCIDGYVARSLVHAVTLLETLVNGDVGVELVEYFSEIPFLPPTPDLDGVRASLKSLGIHFDNLLVISQVDTQNTQHGSAARESLASNSSGVDSVSKNEKNRLQCSSQAQASLQSRLRVLEAMVSHENTSVRVVSLKHLADLLRANRRIFHKLVDSEEVQSMRFLTVIHEDEDEANASGGSSIGRGVVTSLIQSLLARCVLETDTKARLALAQCLGEIGAIDHNRLGGQVDSALSAALTADSFEASGKHGLWLVSQPPWRSQVMRYELRCVLFLVVALKAAPTTLDQHKVAYTIQEILALLNASANRSSTASAVNENSERGKSRVSRKGKMSPWLTNQLTEAGVLEVVEPFWNTSYHQSDKASPRKPPFFRKCTTYTSWLSQWCRFMIFRSKGNSRSRWRHFFHACRSSIRSNPGIRIAEFLLPLLVLDSIAFGDSEDEKNTINELLDALSFNGEKKMPRSEKQKVINAVFTVMDMLEIWNEGEKESRYRSARGISHGSDKRRKPNDYPVDDLQAPWPAEESMACIDDLLTVLPLSDCAVAAADVGMHARSLRFLELQARSQFIGYYDETHGPTSESTFGKQRKLLGIDLGLAQNVLGCLADFDTMSAVAQERKSRDLTDQIEERELLNDWSGALQGYEQALQIHQRSKAGGKISAEGLDVQSLERGLVNSLLEQGQLESVLNQVRGLMHGKSVQDIKSGQMRKHLIPSAVEAAWRLGNWDALQNLLDNELGFDADGTYHVALGKAMLGLQRQSLEDTVPSIEEARQAVLTSLAGAARESYQRVYPYLLRLHCLKEVEDAQESLCHRGSAAPKNFADLVFSDSPHGWEWKGRLQTTTASEVIGSNTIVNVRLSLSHIAGLPSLEGSLWLGVGKRARKCGLYNIAENFLAHAGATCDRLGKESPEQLDHWERPLSFDVNMQLAKLNHATGKTGAALRLLDQDCIHGLLNKEGEELKKVVDVMLTNAKESEGRPYEHVSNYIESLAKEILQGTEWLVEGGLKSGPEIVSRYNLVNNLRNLSGKNWERSHFLFARYLDALLEARILALSGYLGKGRKNVDDDAVREHTMKHDGTCQKYLVLSVAEYGKALQLGQKHVFRALPRLLTLWFDFTTIPPDPTSKESSTGVKGKQTRKAQNASINPNQALLSRQKDANTYMVDFVRKIPPISFYTALPQLISRVGHPNSDTSIIVRAILTRVLERFPRQAMWPLAWLRQSVDESRAKLGEEVFHRAGKSLTRREDMRMHDLLVASKSLLTFLLQLAKYQPKTKGKDSFRCGPWKGEVELSEFVPPIQAALSISPGSAGLTNKDAFPAFVPRMRSFSTDVKIMASKARPKKVTVYAIPAGQKPQGDRSKPHRGDVGEMHFLVKQEVRGDLRKDARVQDLNNVINRLLAGGGGANSKTRRQQRRLHLRTFSVVCLSEDCGLLEWVPNTDSFRNLVTATYNPQADPHSTRRRGKRMTNFGDATMRTAYDKCQNAYFKNGKLTRAAELFEETILQLNPPLFYWWFVRQFPDPHAWFEARTAFTLSAAAWSAVGHVIGLGDRHSENILLDTQTGDCVHVDFDCIFDKGLHLPRPEVVPFRLTANMLDAFGPVGADGAFTGGLIAAMSTLRENRDTLLSVLEPFLKDPVIDWKRHRNIQQDKGKQAALLNQESRDAERSIKVIDGRLKGVYNLRNPNTKKFRRTDVMVEQEDETANIIPLSVEGQVQKMISEASSHENLVQLYVGWMPWL
uniref:non-specific serine/threonine protein kinase n=1 Tax=Odontella aurita TaxID=265563 RepID=A0A7S4J226_9STRA